MIDENDLVQALLPFARAYQRLVHYGDERSEGYMALCEGAHETQLHALDTDLHEVDDDVLLAVRHLREAYEVCHKAGAI